MKAPSLILIIFLVGMVIIIAGLQVVDDHKQQASSQMMEKVITDLTERSRGLESEVKDLRQQLASRRDEPAPAAAATPAPAEPANTTTTTNEPTVKAVQPQPFQARAYVGNDYLGLAWVIPSNIKQDAESGEYRFEPVIWIDEKSRSAFTKTNVVEREVTRSTTYNQSWSYPQPYWYGYPVWVRPGSKHSGSSPPPRRPPVAQPLPQTGGAWAPVTGGPRSNPSDDQRRSDSQRSTAF